MTEAEEIKKVVQASVGFTSKPSDHRSPEYWQNFFLRVDKQIRTNEFKKQGTSISDEVITIALSWRRPIIAIGSVLVIFALVFALWRSNTSLDVKKVTGQPKPPVARSTETDNRIADYFRRSKTLLIGLSNINLDNPKEIDLSSEQRLSRELVNEARNLQYLPMDDHSARLVDDLEKILIELANLKNESDFSNVDIIQSSIYKENLLFKIRMVEPIYNDTRFVNATYEGDR
ncbi:MAG: hypothetical protein HY800_09715 [Ignavibacteriales bacterium]|nr:hypothetical protein [Ignavibacteriales bacterium]